MTNISVFDLFTIGIGPSASHTVAPMRAARAFVEFLQSKGHLPRVARIEITLHGSLAYTGRGHGSDKALILGLHGKQPATVEPTYLQSYFQEVSDNKRLTLLHGKTINFDLRTDLHFNRQRQEHNLMLFRAYSADKQLFAEQSYRSVGGGFLANDKQRPTSKTLPYRFSSAEELLAICAKENFAISDLALANELTWQDKETISSSLTSILAVMRDAIARGISRTGYLPSYLRVKRRASAMHEKLCLQRSSGIQLNPLDWVNMYAIAVNEENASGERVVAAPTNGASGIIPAVVSYFEKFCDHPTPAKSQQLLLTAGCIGMLYKMNASLSGAEVGCQGEVGVACSMAAGGLTEVLGGTVQQVEEAAEIAIEHNLGLTCDPIGGLVQIPCIERNAMGAIKAINASRLALQGTGKHVVSLDSAIKTMLATGKDMKSKYKETSRGGLAVNVVEC